jgi:hypothetical protein
MPGHIMQETRMDIDVAFGLTVLLTVLSADAYSRGLMNPHRPRGNSRQALIKVAVNAQLRAARSHVHSYAFAHAFRCRPVSSTLLPPSFLTVPYTEKEGIKSTRKAIDL